jgi:hypothetical protein
MVKSIARTYHWKPQDIMNLYFDKIDMYGLIYWYEDAKEMDSQIKI